MHITTLLFALAILKVNCQIVDIGRNIYAYDIYSRGKYNTVSSVH